MKILDPNDTFFAPVWRRWATSLAPLAWGAFEIFAGNAEWGVLFMAVGIYAFYVLILIGPSGNE